MVLFPTHKGRKIAEFRVESVQQRNIQKVQRNGYQKANLATGHAKMGAATYRTFRSCGHLDLVTLAVGCQKLGDAIVIGCGVFGPEQSSNMAFARIG